MLKKTYGCAEWTFVSTCVLTAINISITTVGSKICQIIKQIRK